MFNVRKLQPMRKLLNRSASKKKRRKNNDQWKIEGNIFHLRTSPSNTGMHRSGSAARRTARTDNRAPISSS